MKELYRKITTKHYYSIPGFSPSTLLPIPEEEDEAVEKPKKVRMYRNSLGQRVAQLSPKELYLREQYARMYGKKFNGKLLGPYAAAKAAASKRSTGQGTDTNGIGYGNSSSNYDYDDDDDSSISDVLDDGDSDSMEYEESDSDDDYYGGAGGAVNGEAGGEADGEADGNSDNNNGNDGNDKGGDDGADHDDGAGHDDGNNSNSGNDNDASNNDQPQQQQQQFHSSPPSPGFLLKAEGEIPSDSMALVFLTPKNLHGKLRLMQQAGWVSVRARYLIASLKLGTNNLYPICEVDEAEEGEGGGAVLFLPSEQGHHSGPRESASAASYGTGSVSSFSSSRGSAPTSNIDFHSRGNSGTEADSGNPIHRCCRPDEAEIQEDYNSETEVWRARKRVWKGKAVVGVAMQPDGDNEAWLDSFRERPTGRAA